MAKTPGTVSSPHWGICTRMLAVWLLIFGWLSVSSLSAQVHVSAGLTADVAGVGEAIQLHVRVEGARAANVPSQIDVEGLDIRYVQQSSQVQIHNFKLTATAVYVYRVVGLREGEYQIPPIKVSVGGTQYQTDPLMLTIDTGSSRNIPGAQGVPPPVGQQDPTGQSETNNPRVAYAELLGVKKSAFVGEVIPVEIRFYFDRRFSVQIQGPPNFGGEGFTARKLADYTKAFQEIDGVPYEIWRFQTSIVPVKSGVLEIDPASLTILVQTGGMPSIDDFFQRFMGGGLPPGFGGAEEMVVRSNAAEIEVKPLPTAGRPDSFDGAVGEFTLSAEADPLTVRSGDPVTLKMNVSGRGNFDAMGPPRLVDKEGWRTYPPKEEFKAADSIGYEGEKIFESLLIAQQTLQRTPGVEFSYFDPNLEEYKTVTVAPISVEAEGSGIASATPQAATQPDPSPATPTADDSVEPAVTKAAPMKVARWDARFIPAWDTPLFFVIQCVGAAAFLALLAIGAARAIRQSDGSRRRKESREMRRLLSRIEKLSENAGEFYVAAADWLRRLAKGETDAGHLTMDDVMATLNVNDETAEDVRRIFRRHEELHYSGRLADQPVDPEERNKTLATLRSCLVGKRS